MLKRILMRAGIGFLIGMVIGNLIAILTGNANSGGERFTSLRLIEMAGGSEAVAMILQSLFSGMYGAVCFAGMTFYEIERMPLAAATFSHCALIIILFILIGLLLGWLNNIAEVLIMASIQLICFFIIWLILYAVYKKQVRELNELQEKVNEQK